MKEKDKINFLKLLKRHVEYKDGFWFLDKKLSSEKAVREFIKIQDIPILEKDITDLISELSYNFSETNIEKEFNENLLKMAKEGKSKYFESLDKLYPNNKFRQIMNYYLFSEDVFCFILIGYGQTGKTTFVSLIGKILGEAYFGRANVSLLKNSHGTAVLEGKKIFEVAEAQDLDLNTANLLKSIITNDDIYVNPKFQLQRIIKPHAKLIMTCNNIPRFKVTDDGVIRRFILIKMNNKIEKQDKHFLEDMDEDIPFIVYEALNNPFKIEDFAEEQYEIFRSDPQFGFGYGVKNLQYDGSNDYEKYVTMCKALGFHARNKQNFDKFIELEKIYKARIKCDTISKDLEEQIGMTSLTDLEADDLPF